MKKEEVLDFVFDQFLKSYWKKESKYLKRFAKLTKELNEVLSEKYRRKLIEFSDLQNEAQNEEEMALLKFAFEFFKSFTF